MSFVRRKITVIFDIGQGETGFEGSSTLSLSDLRVSAKILYAGGQMMGRLNLAIYGMTSSHEQQLSTLGMQLIIYRRNIVTVLAGDQENGMSVVFKGTITNAWSDRQNAPNAVFRVEAQEGLIESVKPTDPISFDGATKVSLVAEKIAQSMGYNFENNGVQAVLNDPYFWGAARNMLLTLVKQARIEHVMQGGTLAIWEMGQGRSGDTLLVSPETGMVSYPAFTSTGVLVKQLFSKPVFIGQKMVVKSEIKAASREWHLNRVDYSLESNMPNGEWFVSLYGTPPGLGPVRP